MPDFTDREITTIFWISKEDPVEWYEIRYSEIPDCQACPMPQEMRWPENRKEPAIPEVEKLMALHSYLSLPSVIEKGSVFQEIVVQVILFHSGFSFEL